MFEATALNRRNALRQKLFRAGLGTMTGLLILPVALILGTLIYKGAPVISFEFLFTSPTDGMTAGGIFPALLGTVLLVVVALLASVPLGIAAAIYLSEYAPDNWFTRAINLAIINLAGVPSIVHALFGVGAFVIFFRFGTSILAASLTLAIMTLPVVIVATRESLQAVPMAFREACWNMGATRWQTIRRVVLPRALPGVMTGAILAMARGAGEVAPLMLVGAVKLAPELPIDGHWPFLHMERSFMHLGFHIYDLGFQSQNSEAAKPMVFTTTMLLMGIVLFLNAAAIWFRSRLAVKFTGSKF